MTTKPFLLINIAYNPYLPAHFNAQRWGSKRVEIFKIGYTWSTRGQGGKKEARNKIWAVRDRGLLYIK